MGKKQLINTVLRTVNSIDEGEEKLKHEAVDIKEMEIYVSVVLYANDQINVYFYLLLFKNLPFDLI